MLSQEVLTRRGWKPELYHKLINHSILKVLDQYLQPGKLTIDVGGNTGYQTYFHAQHNDVVTYEPVPGLFDVLKENLKDLNNVTFVNKAVGGENGTVKLFVDVKRLSMTSQIPLVECEEIEVPIIALDNEGHENVGFIKVDVEGFELPVLKGAEKIIDRDRPTMMVEIYQPWCDKTGIASDEYFKFFDAKDYTCWYYNCQTNEMVQCKTVQDGIDAVKNDHALHDGDFLFIPKESV